MPDDGALQVPADGLGQVHDAASARYDRPSLLGFITDARSEEALREGLAEVTGEQLDIRRGGVRTAVTAMQKLATPRVLVVYVSGEDQPLTALGDLAHVVEPDVCVLVIGETNNVDFYREVTRGMGAADYLAKPLTRDIVARHFSAFLRGKTPAAQAALGGRVIALTGVRGGVGATTLAVNLAWNFGVVMRRHTVLVDPNIQTGSAAFLLNVQPGPGLRVALEAPERLDLLLAERAAQPAADRLHVLAGEEAVAIQPNPAPGAAHGLLDALRSRYNFIVADVPFAPVPLYRDLLDLVDQRVLVMEPTLAAVRDTLRLLALPGEEQSQRAIVVLNSCRHHRWPDTPASGRCTENESGYRYSRPAAAGRQRRDPGRARDGFVQRLSGRGERVGAPGGVRRLARLRLGRGDRRRRIGCTPELESVPAQRMNTPIPSFGRRAGAPPVPLRPAAAPPKPEPAAHVHVHVPSAAPEELIIELRNICLARLDPAAVAAMPAIRY